MRDLRDYRGLIDFGDGLCEPHRGNLVSAIALGICTALIVAIYGLFCIVSGEGTFIGSRPVKLVTYTGIPARCLGAAYISAVCFLHCHFVWSAIARYHGFAQLGKFVAATIAVVAICAMVFYVIVYM